jgi:hypothetical protein
MVGGYNLGNGYNAIIGLTDTAYEENLKGANQRGRRAWLPACNKLTLPASTCSHLVANNPAQK